MSEPFRDELAAAHARIAELEARLAERESPEQSLARRRRDAETLGKNVHGLKRSLVVAAQMYGGLTAFVVAAVSAICLLRGSFSSLVEWAGGLAILLIAVFVVGFLPFLSHYFAIRRAHRFELDAIHGDAMHVQLPLRVAAVPMPHARIAVPYDGDDAHRAGEESFGRRSDET